MSKTASPNVTQVSRTTGFGVENPQLEFKRVARKNIDEANASRPNFGVAASMSGSVAAEFITAKARTISDKYGCNGIIPTRQASAMTLTSRSG